MRHYLAARYSRRDELCSYRADLEARGHSAPARWLLGEHQAHGLEAARAVQGNGPIPAAEALAFATDDVEDILAADVLVAFTEVPRTASVSRGGRHVELGIALGLRLAGLPRPACYLVGPVENVFHALRTLDGRFDDWAGYLAHLEVTTWPTWPDGILTGRSRDGAAT